MASESGAVIKIEPPDRVSLGLDVVIPAHNRLELTITCLKSLYSFTRTPFHLIVIDDSTDLTPLYMAQFCKEHDNVTYVHSDEPYKNGNQIFNIGFRNAKTDFIATVMNSVRVEPDWEVVALQIIKGDPKVGVIGLKCLFPDGKIESAGIRMISYLPTDIGRDWASHRLSTVHEPDAVQWAFALHRKQAVLDLEETVFHGFRGWDDIDNCFVVKKRGFKVLSCGLGVGYHTPRATRGDDSPTASQENRENGHLFYKRWGLWENFIKEHPDGVDVHALPREVLV